jgi:hypothetical protein
MPNYYTVYYAMLAISGGHCTSRTQALLFLKHVIAKHRDNQQDCEIFWMQQARLLRGGVAWQMQYAAG